MASRVDGQGALILSPFTGASRELTAAYAVNPFNPENIADALFEALDASDEDPSTRMENMRAWVQEHNIYYWAAQHRPSQRKNLDLAPEEVQVTKTSIRSGP